MSNNKIEYIKEFNDAIFQSDATKKKNTLVFIYTPPKVGSTTLVSSFRVSCARRVNVLHVHDETMLSIITGIKNNNNITVNELIDYNASIGKIMYVIDVYRNPIERKISEFFELLTSYHFNTTDNNIGNYKIELLIKRFNSLFPYLGAGDYFFDKYDINVPEIFDFENKYLLVEKNNIKYIKLRLSDSSEWSKILTNILNMDIVIIKDYQTENKVIGEVYKKFNQQYRIPYNLLETIVQCKYFNYYNSQSERENYINKWNSKVETNAFEPYTLEKYNFYKEFSGENQFHNIIQREHYLDHGCICNSCCYKRRQIFLRIKNGDINIDTKIIHEQAVQEKKNRKVQRIGNICNKIQDKLNEISKIQTSKGKINMKVQI
uniref:Uncharacterized protein n=1 Tax=viral metagenome TaxID=1070528 RepID=A0A6C0JFJ1_9ZZZZ